jgi:hypothetical protein
MISKGEIIVAHRAIRENRECRFQGTSLKSSIVLLLVLSVGMASCAGFKKGESLRKAKAEIERLDPFMGDWRGSWKLDDGTDTGPVMAQVIALGDGKYRANFIEQFDTRAPTLAVLESQVQEGKLRFKGPGQYVDVELDIEAVAEGGKFTGRFQAPDAAGSFAMERTVRLSPTLGEKPPSDSVVLFTGKNFNEWKYAGNKPGPVQWKLVDGAMEVKPGTGSIITKKEFVNTKLHLEFRSPFMPKARGQGRGNSGVYLQGRYEVQVLDSYGLEGRDNECGGIYRVAAPLVNMCAPPMQWQTYDIIFSAPRFDSTGKRVKDALMTVIHNGVKIHDNVKVSKATTAAPGGNITQRGGIYLQDHGNRVQYRNIWLVDLPE